MAKFSKELEVAIKAAKEAGKVLMNYYNKKNISHNKKSDNSFVSEADLAAEKTILRILQKEFPKYSFYSEEKGKSENTSEYCWYIDPLDGTHNFLHKIPLFGISISLSKNKKFTIGVIYLPYTDELFYAEKKKGAYLNKKKISVSTLELKDAAFCAPSSYVHQKGNIVKLLNIFQPKCSDSRMMGSCALDLAYLSCGRFDFYIKPSITPYDTGAGKVILEEAGGKLTKIDGSEFESVSDKYNFIASNNIFHNDLIKIMKEEFK